MAASFKKDALSIQAVGSWQGAVSRLEQLDKSEWLNVNPFNQVFLSLNAIKSPRMRRNVHCYYYHFETSFSFSLLRII